MEKKLRLALYIKMLVGFSVAFIIAYLLQLPYSYTAGVIAVLHLWYSRDTVFKAALTRLFASVVGLAVSALLFFLFNYELYSLFLVVLLTIAALYLLKLEYGATIALVLIGQQWAEQTAWAPLNAFFIMLIGTIPALLLNFFTLQKSQLLETQKHALDNELARIFTYFERDEQYDFTQVEKLISATQKNLQIALENYRVENVIDTYNYITTRINQVTVLKRIVNQLNAQHASPYKAEITKYLASFQTQIGTIDYASGLKIELEALVNHYRLLPLPATREEFEHRALLFATLADIKAFLDIKISYHEKVTKSL